MTTRERFGRTALACLIAGAAACAPSFNRPGAPAAIASSQPRTVAPAQARSEPGPTLAFSVRPARGRRLRTDGTFWYWLELRNVSGRSIALKSKIAVSFPHLHSDRGAGAGNADWAPCLSDSFLILPGQTLAQAGGASQQRLKPGPATLEFAVSVRAANLDGSCAEKVYELRTVANVDVLPANPGAKTGIAAVRPPPAIQGPASTFSLSMRPVAEGDLRAGAKFSYWLGLENVSNEAVAVHSDFGISLAFSQGDHGGGDGRPRWPLCEWETYRVLPGQTLTRLSEGAVGGVEPGPARLWLWVKVREANPDGTCAEREYAPEMTTNVNVVAARPG
jgi:hypothetical protein